MIIGSRPVLKTGGRESGLRVRVPWLPHFLRGVPRAQLSQLFGSEIK